MDILKEFRQLAGIKGRSMHRPTMPPKYDFKVKVELDSGSGLEHLQYAVHRLAGTRDLVRYHVRF